MSQLGSQRLLERAFAPVDIASLVWFRIAFGAVMIWEVVRYFQKGWIPAYYIEPEFHFTYYGFGWVTPWPGQGMYIHFVVLGLAAFGIMAGLWYRLSAAVFFAGFAYVFLLDQAYYLNHFYLITLVALLLVFLPAHRAFSLDVLRRPELRSECAPAWALWLLRAQIGIPYFYGGLAKLNGDWLRGEPIRSWLAGRTDFPLIGRFFEHEWMVAVFAYGGLLLDLAIVPLLLWKRTRPWAFGSALAFHGLNAMLFNIGIFPWLMIAATLIFFEPDWPRRLRLLPPPRAACDPAAFRPRKAAGARLTVAIVGVYLAAQALVPLRHVVYPGNVSWTEQGHLFSWHMKLRDKEARTHFVVRDPETGESWTERPRDYLTRRQTIKMAGHPDMILQFAHLLARQGREPGRPSMEVRVQAMASLNGRERQLLVDPTTDVAAQPRSLAPASWIRPLYQPLRTARSGAGPDVDE
jgi:hypothetical protein